MACVECGAKTGTAGRCRRCKAPVVERITEVAPTGAAKPDSGRRVSSWVVRLLVGVVNLIALWFAVGFVSGYLTQGSPSQAGNDYMPLWACIFGATMFASVLPITVAIWIGIRRDRQRRAVTGIGVAAAELPERARGYSRSAVRSYLELTRDLREKGFAPAPGAVFPHNWRLSGYDPDAVDRHVTELARDAAAAGLRVLPALPTETGVPRTNRLGESKRAQRRRYESDEAAAWQHVGSLPGARLKVARSKAWRRVYTVAGNFGEVLLTRRSATTTLATGQVLRFERNQLTDSATGDQVLWIRGINFARIAGGLVLLPGQRYLVFPVTGSRPGNAVMTAVSESGTTMLWFRRMPKGVIEVVVAPDCPVTGEVLCAIGLTANWLAKYFASPGGGG
jgi:hypothetical protein